MWYCILSVWHLRLFYTRVLLRNWLLTHTFCYIMISCHGIIPSTLRSTKYCLPWRPTKTSAYLISNSCYMFFPSPCRNNIWCVVQTMDWHATPSLAFCYLRVVRTNVYIYIYIYIYVCVCVCVCVQAKYRGADKSLARAGRKQANVSVRMTWISFGRLALQEKKIDDS